MKLVHFVVCVLKCILKTICPRIPTACQHKKGCLQLCSRPMETSADDAAANPTIDDLSFLGNELNYLSERELSALRKRKLVMLLDLDLTLMHGERPTPSSRQLPNTFICQPIDDYSWVVRARPGLEWFLQTMGEFFDIYLNTHAVKRYAEGLLSNAGVDQYIGKPIFCREHSFIPKEQQLKDAFLHGDSTLVKVDDLPTAWLYTANLIQVWPYWGLVKSYRVPFSLYGPLCPEEHGMPAIQGWNEPFAQALFSKKREEFKQLATDWYFAKVVPESVTCPTVVKRREKNLDQIKLPKFSDEMIFNSFNLFSSNSYEEVGLQNLAAEGSMQKTDEGILVENEPFEPTTELDPPWKSQEPDVQETGEDEDEKNRDEKELESLLIADLEPSSHAHREISFKQPLPPTGRDPKGKTRRLSATSIKEVTKRADTPLPFFTAELERYSRSAWSTDSTDLALVTDKPFSSLKVESKENPDGGSSMADREEQGELAEESGVLHGIAVENKSSEEEAAASSDDAPKPFSEIRTIPVPEMDSPESVWEMSQDDLESLVQRSRRQSTDQATSSFWNLPRPEAVESDVPYHQTGTNREERVPSFPLRNDQDMEVTDPQQSDEEKDFENIQFVGQRNDPMTDECEADKTYTEDLKEIEDLRKVKTTEEITLPYEVITEVDTDKEQPGYHGDEMILAGERQSTINQNMETSFDDSDNKQEDKKNVHYVQLNPDEDEGIHMDDAPAYNDEVDAPHSIQPETFVPMDLSDVFFSEVAFHGQAGILDVEADDLPAHQSSMDTDRKEDTAVPEENPRTPRKSQKTRHDQSAPDREDGAEDEDFFPDRDDDDDDSVKRKTSSPSQDNESKESEVVDYNKDGHVINISDDDEVKLYSATYKREECLLETAVCLLLVHTQYFAILDQVRQQGLGIVPCTQQLMAALKKRVLRGARVAFGKDVTLAMQEAARDLGAEVVTSLGQATHFVINELAPVRDDNIGRRYKDRVKTVIWPWVLRCYQTWAWLDEEPFQVIYSPEKM